MHRRFLLPTLLFAIAATLFSKSASASPVAIVDTGSPSLSLLDGGLGGPLNQSIAAEFTVTQSWVITEVQGWIDPIVSGDVRFRLYSDGGDVPGVALFDQLLSISGTGATAWYGPSGLSWSIGAGSYWMAFESPNTFDGGMPFPSASPLPNGAVRVGAALSYTANDNMRPGVRIFAEAAEATPVPEPASLLLLGTSLVGFVANRKYGLRRS